MKKNFMKKLLCVIVFSVIVMSTFTLVASAEQDELIEWTLSEDKNFLTSSEGKVYQRYEGEINAYLDPSNTYCFDGYVEGIADSFYYEGTSPVYSYARDGEIVWVRGGKRDYIYATVTGARMLDDFASGKDLNYYVSDSRYAKVSGSFAEQLEEEYNGPGTWYAFDVRELEDEIVYTLKLCDDNEIFWRDVGYIFNIHGDYYYVHFDSLDNTHFDANGDFSFRSGQVMLTKLEGDLHDEFEVAEENLDWRETSYIYEYDEYSADMPMVLFWIPYLFIGFVLPVPFLVLGIIFANVRKKSKYWYAVVISAAAWLLLAAILMIILLI